MRSIDADALKEAIEKNGCRHSHYFDVFDVIDDAPTIEPFEKIGAICNENRGDYRPKGEWEEMSDGQGHSSYFCSRCGTQEGKTYAFCPNCGADMRGD